MNIRTTLFSLIIASLFSATAFAQTDGGRLTPEQRIEKRLAHAKKRLNLTDEQAAKLRSILEQNRAKIKADREAVRNAESGDARKDARKQMKSDMKGVRDQMKGVLTPDQIRKFKEMRIKRIERKQERLERRKERLKR